MMSPNVSAPLAGRQVLVVEDEFFVADDLDRALSALGAAVVGPIPTVEEALGLMADGVAVDVAVLDINLRGRNGFAVADELLRLAIPFVFATGYDGTHLPPRFRHVPQWRKPFSAEALAAGLTMIDREMGPPESHGEDTRLTMGG